MLEGTANEQDSACPRLSLPEVEGWVRVIRLQGSGSISAACIRGSDDELNLLAKERGETGE